MAGLATRGTNTMQSPSTSHASIELKRYGQTLREPVAEHILQKKISTSKQFSAVESWVSTTISKYTNDMYDKKTKTQPLTIELHRYVKQATDNPKWNIRLNWLHFKDEISESIKTSGKNILQKLCADYHTQFVNLYPDWTRLKRRTNGFRNRIAQKGVIIKLYNMLKKLLTYPDLPVE